MVPTTLSLPVCLIDIVLSLAPHFSLDQGNQDREDTQLPLLKVLPPAHVPCAYASIFRIVNTGPECELYDAGPDTALDVHVFANLEEPNTVWAIVERFFAHNMLSKDKRFCARLLDALCIAGQLEVLKRLHARGLAFAGLRVRLFDSASQGGHVPVLVWLESIGLGALEHMHSVEAALLASRAGHSHVLDWWATSSVQIVLRRDDCRTGVKYGCRNGNLDVVRYWFHHEDAAFEYCHWLEASEYGQVQVLAWAKRNADRYDVTFPDHSTATVPTPIDLASIEGHIACLEWWYLHMNVHEYSVHAIDGASANGHLDVLEWWAQSGLELKFTPAARERALQNGHIHVVDWWDRCPRYRILRFSGNSRLPEDRPSSRIIGTDPVTLASFGRLEWMPRSYDLESEPADILDLIRTACSATGNVHVLESCVVFKRLAITTMEPFLAAAEHNQVVSLEWLARNVTPLPTAREWYTILSCAVTTGSTSTADWLFQYLNVNCRDSPLSESSMRALVACAACCGHTDILDVLERNGAPFEPYDKKEDPLSEAAESGHVNVFSWWHAKGFTLPPSTQITRPMERACIYDQVDIIQWNVSADLALPISRRALELAYYNDSIKVMRYCLSDDRVPIPTPLKSKFSAVVHDSDSDSY